MSLLTEANVGGKSLKKGDGEDKDRQSCAMLRSCRTGDLHSKLGEGLHNTWKTIQSTKTVQSLCCQMSLFHPLSQPITQLMDPIYLKCSSTEFLESALRSQIPKVKHRTLFNRLCSLNLKH